MNGKIREENNVCCCELLFQRKPDRNEGQYGKQNVVLLETTAGFCSSCNAASLFDFTPLTCKCAYLSRLAVLEDFWGKQRG